MNAPPPSPPSTATMLREVRAERRGAWRRVSRLAEVMAPYWFRWLLATLALFVGGVIALVYPWAASYAIDEGVSKGRMDVLDEIVIGLSILFLIDAVLTWVRHYLMSWLGERAVAEMRRRVFSRILDMEPAWFHSRSTGELVSRLASDVTVIQGVVGSEVSLALRNLLQFVGGLAVLFYQDTELTLVMMLVVPPLAVGVVVIGRGIRRRSRAVQDRLAEASARVSEAVSAIETVQSFVRQEDEAERYARGVEAAFEAARRLSIWRGLFMAIASAAGLASFALVLWLGGRAVANGEMTAGDLTAFMLYTLMVGAALGSLAGLWASLARAAGATDRLFAVADSIPEIRDPKVPVPLPDGGGELRFEGIEHRFATRPEIKVLDGIDLTLRAGETVALVGRSGAGKTTFARLIPRFFDPIEGRVLFDGVDVRDLAVDELRGAIAVVAQEPVLFSGTISENIAYGRAGATEAEIIQAARDAYIEELIDSLPDGFQTMVGERGVQLSGGQRQRIALARALLKNPRLLILDEATSHLDAESEAAIQKALDVLLEGRTALIIAHRLSTVRRADRIVVIDHGRIVEEGKHETLMSRDGLYRHLVELQLLDEDLERARHPETSQA